jgi:hypothetical protein
LLKHVSFSIDFFIAMYAILFVAVVGGTLVARSFLLFRRVGRPGYEGQDKKLLSQAMWGIIISFVLVLAVSAFLKFSELDQ